MHPQETVKAKFLAALDREFDALDQAGLPCGPDEMARIGTGALRQLSVEELHILRTYARAGARAGGVYAYTVLALECRRPYAHGSHRLARDERSGVGKP